MEILKFCKNCRYFQAESQFCEAPQHAHNGRLILGEPSPGAKMPASDARFNPVLCSMEGFWYAPK